jgi:CheY-like chemotaxis protein
LTVSDDGIGIAPEVMRTIFDPFVQGSTTLDRTDGGIGVGLAVVRSLVEMHGGTVMAHSDGLGHGSVFSVRLPLPGPEACAESESKPPASLLQGRRVVLIEDNDDSREMLQLLLETAGYEVFAASDGESGLALIQSKRPDTAIVDIGLPCIDGFEIARRLRADESHAGLRLVALTGYGQATDQEAAREAGFDEHVVKPLDPEQIARLLQNAS